jgi:hypothetical protein
MSTATQMAHSQDNTLTQVAKRFQGMLRQEAPPRLPQDAGHHACVVFLNTGVHAGAQIRVTNSPTRLGSASDNDVVLRDAGVLPHHAELRRVDGRWALYVVDGVASFPPLVSGERGQFVRQRHAIGGCGLVLSQRRPLDKTPPSKGLRWKSTLAALVVPGLFVAAAALGAVGLMQLVKPTPTLALAQNRSLAAEGWPDVQLQSKPSQETQITGYVNTPAALTALRQWVKGQGMDSASMLVRVGDDMAAKVREAVGDPGLKVSYLGAGRVRVAGSSNDLALRTRLLALRTDLAGAVLIDDQVAFAAQTEPPRQHTLPVRILGISPGPNGSFTTVDGARYFVGGVLSDGAEVTAIQRDGIAFKMGEKNVFYPLN